MFEWINNNIDLAIKYSRYYMGVSLLIFIAFGGAEFELLSDRLLMAFGLIVGYFMFSKFARFYLKMQSKIHKYSWGKVEKMLKLQANCVIGFGIFGTIFYILAGVLNIRILPLALFFINITIGLVLGTIKAKHQYFIKKDLEK